MIRQRVVGTAFLQVREVGIPHLVMDTVAGAGARSTIQGMTLDNGDPAALEWLARSFIPSGLRDR